MSDPFWVRICIWYKVRDQLHIFAFGYPVDSYIFLFQAPSPPFSPSSYLDYRGYDWWCSSQLLTIREESTEFWKIWHRAVDWTYYAKKNPPKWNKTEKSTLAKSPNHNYLSVFCYLVAQSITLWFITSSFSPKDDISCTDWYSTS